MSRNLQVLKNVKLFFTVKDINGKSVRSAGGGNGNLLQYSRLENLMDRAAWQASVHGTAKNQTRLSD